MKFAAALTAVALLLAGLWFLYEPSGANASNTDGSGRSERSEANVDSLGEDELAAVTSDSDAREESPGRGPRSAGSSGPERSHASIAASDESDRIIVGRITDGDGAPLVGSDVRVSKERSLWEIAGADEDAHVNASTDGSFRLVVPPGTLQVVAGADGYAPLERRISASDVGEIDLGTLRLAPGVTLTGRVLDAANRPVAGATLHRRGASRSGFVVINGRGGVVTSTDEAGRFEVLRQSPGTFDFVVVHEGHPEGGFDGTTEVEGETVSGIEVRLGEGASVTGLVRGAPTDAIEELEVRALYSPAGVDGAASEFERRGRGARVAADGSFVIHGLPPEGEIELRLLRGEGAFFERARCSESVHCRAGDGGVVVPFSDGASIEFRVSDATGDPIEGATISTGFDYSRPYSGDDVELGGGRYRINGLWPPDAAGTALELSVAAPGYEPAHLDLGRLRPGELMDAGTVTLETKPTVTVTVLDRTSRRPVEGARVRLRYDVREDSGAVRGVFFANPTEGDGDEHSLEPFAGSPAEALTDSEGRCAIEITPQGDAIFEVTHPRYAEQATEPVAIDSLGTAGRPGQFAMEVALDPGGSIDVTVVDPDGVPVPGRRVERKVFAGGPKPSPSTTNSEGIARFEGVATGEHRVRLGKKRRGSGFVLIAPGAGASSADEHDDWANVLVTEGETAQVTLVAPFPSTLRGVVSEAGKALAGAEISIAPKDDGANPGFATIFGGPETVTTDARGEFFFDDVEIGEQELTIDHVSRSMPFRQTVVIEDGENETEVDLDVTIVRGVCRDPKGEPLAGARVTAARVREEGGRATAFTIRMAGGGETTTLTSGTATSSVTTGEDGEFELRGVAAEVPIVVKASASGFDTAESESLEVPLGGVKDGVEIRFEMPGDLEIEVDGDPATELLAVAMRVGAAAGAPRTQPFSGSVATIEGLEPGEWSVNVTAVNVPGAEPVTITPERQTVTIEPGETAKLRFEAK